MRERIIADWIERDARFGVPSAAVPSVEPTEPLPVTTAEDAAGGCDGVKNGKCGFHTASQETDPWWQVDLGEIRRLDRIVIFNRTDGNTASRTRHLIILAATENAESQFRVYEHDGASFTV